MRNDIEMLFMDAEVVIREINRDRRVVLRSVWQWQELPKITCVRLPELQAKLTIARVNGTYSKIIQ